ncbi:MAG: twin-arginine translocase TatA/TatE family subunit [Ignavibacteria bacterium]|nr:twin-arginine translocase TatA/TatE family subunit [Ignavibacteria bacterium]
MFQNIGFGEILIIVLVVMVFFGGKKIPELAQGLGKGMREFKRALKDEEPEKLDKNSQNQSSPKE